MWFMMSNRKRSEYLSCEADPSLKLMESGLDWSLLKETQLVTGDFGLSSFPLKSNVKEKQKRNINLFFREIRNFVIYVTIWLRLEGFVIIIYIIYTSTAPCEHVKDLRVPLCARHV